MPYKNREDQHAAMRKHNMKSRYGITIDDYNRMFKEQEGRCKICGAHQSEFSTRLHVDHNHETGKVRGLLCNSCNMGIGNFKDNIDLLLDVIEYLR